MKTLEEYMALPYRLEIIPDPDEGGFVGTYPDLPGCLTSGDTMEAVAHNAEDAKRAWLTAALQDGLAIREPESPLRILRPVQAAHSKISAPLLGRALPKRRNQHESVLPVPSGQKRRAVRRITLPDIHILRLISEWRG